MAPPNQPSSVFQLFTTLTYNSIAIPYYLLATLPLFGLAYGLKRLKDVFNPGWEMSNKGVGGKKGDGKPERFGVRVDRNGRIQESGSGKVVDKEYDFVIIGGGTAGLVLASRLSSPSVYPPLKVLVLESGPLTKPPLSSVMPAGFPKVWQDPRTDWGVWTCEQEEMLYVKGGREPPERETWGDEKKQDSVTPKGRRMRWPRGRLLGGCSSVNAMMCHHAHPGDFDEWERMGHQGWGYESLKPYFSKSETLHPSSDWPVSASHRTFNTGPMKIGYSHLAPISRAFIHAVSKLGIDLVGDLNANETSRGTCGVAWAQSFINKGERQSTATGYLTPDVVERENLDIATGMNVTRILFDSGNDPKPRAVGVEFTPYLVEPEKVPMDKRAIYQVKARREVLLCGGAVNSPQILKLSGVGPKEELDKFDIPTIKHLPGVGENLKDHISYGVLFEAEKGSSIHYISKAGGPALREWLRYRTGPLTSNLCEALGFVNTQDPKANGLAGLDPPQFDHDLAMAAGPDCPDLEIIAGPISFGVAGSASDYLSLGGVPLKPRSTGSIKLRSADPFMTMRVDPRYLTHEDDRRTAVWGLKFMLKVAQQEPLKSMITPHRPVLTEPGRELPFFPELEKHSDEELLERVQKWAETIYHPVGTVAMGKEEGGGCVDDSLRVWGIDGLRVIDCSIFPTQIAGHPMAPIIAISEKMSEEILRDVLAERTVKS